MFEREWFKMKFTFSTLFLLQIREFHPYVNLADFFFSNLKLNNYGYVEIKILKQNIYCWSYWYLHCRLWNVLTLTNLRNPNSKLAKKIVIFLRNYFLMRNYFYSQRRSALSRVLATQIVNKILRLIFFISFTLNIVTKGSFQQENREPNQNDSNSVNISLPMRYTITNKNATFGLEINVVVKFSGSKTNEEVENHTL